MLFAFSVWTPLMRVFGKLGAAAKEERSDLWGALCTVVILVAQEPLQIHQLQAGDFLEVALVACGDGVAALQRTGSDEEIIERDVDALL